ncbi:UvrD-helicase domain-containing protein [Zhouia amylolytica]|uniref:UvrD-helicase domain-containing protein n=1 Tax=Zhouia amylolytica TaxID=376730 RepID=UPI0020CE3FD0|nr:UvrD-helicase domain-containing protein [Zhouia amylolytica]MCQ0110910.1 UvrD-helicase domain-containing protein [Zhouia amylolytica]
MNATSPQFLIYNASAGSGKTFTLVKNYLKILLGSNNTDTFKQVLAITFTNKAVAEMKTRVVSNLEEFASKASLEEPSDMFTALATELNLDNNTLHTRASKVLERILHNYAFFDIVTIDKFNHRLLRTFAFDLKLPSNFEVALDTDMILQQAVDNLVYQAGNEELLTKTLVDFALEKADDDKSWDITRDLNQIGKLLMNEVHLEHIHELGDRSLKDFADLTRQIKKLRNTLRDEIIKKGEEVLALLHKNNLDARCFSRGTLYNHFKKISQGELDKLYENKLEDSLSENKSLYPKSVSEDIATTIDGLVSVLYETFLAIKKQVYHLDFLDNFYKNLVPLSLLNAINQELEKLKEQENILLISDFNEIISKAIANQPAPFIYERIGEKYKHYFADEFQDTSEMQWKNIQPLIANALESESLAGKKGSLLIVGDAKQAIYRWRGGKAEQFIELYNCHNPFQVEKQVENLPKNYRSYTEVVNFNNSFFRHVSQHLNKPEYRDLFETKSHQETNQKKGGYVSLTFLEKEASDNEAYCEATLETIKSVQAKGYSLKDICILTRKKKEGLAIAHFLSEHNIPIISSESLLLKNDIRIDFIINLMQFSVVPENKETQVRLLHYLAQKKEVTNQHGYIIEGLKDFNSFLSGEGFSSNEFSELPLLNAISYAISSFKLNNSSDAYLQYFLDVILEFSQQNSGSITDFLAYWEKKKDVLSIIAPEGLNAIQLMTVHKSKGLEFPVVIYPFAHSNIYEEIDPKIWYPLNEDIFGIKRALLSKNKKMASYSELGEALYTDDHTKLELDQFNVLYVALTRAVKELHIITRKDLSRNGEESLSYFSGLFINFLKSTGKWSDEQCYYSFGTTDEALSEKVSAENNHPVIPFNVHATYQSSLKLVTKAGSLWETHQQEAIERGNLYHNLLAEIKYASELEEVIQEGLLTGILREEEQEMVKHQLKRLMEHPILEPYYSHEYTILNEREIYTSDGKSLRPDRIVIKHQKVILIDYKTGSMSNRYINQLNTYANALISIGYEVEKKLIVFIDKEVEIIEV